MSLLHQIPYKTQRGVIINVGLDNDTFHHYLWVVADTRDCISPDFTFGKDEKYVGKFRMSVTEITHDLADPGTEYFDPCVHCSLSATFKNSNKTPGIRTPGTEIQMDICVAGSEMEEKKIVKKIAFVDNCLEKEKQLCSFGLFHPKFMKIQEDPEASKVLVIDFKICVGTNDSLPNISSDFADLLYNHYHSDVEVVVGGEIFHLHKAVLAARSPVFSAMLASDMQERNRNLIKIPDIEAQVFLKLLEYIYTDKVEDIENYAQLLIELSERYQLLGLKAICLAELRKNLTIDNAIETLVLADLYCANDLKSNTLSFIGRQQQTPRLDSLAQSYPQLLLEILYASSRN